ncbi:MAG: DUF3244 domain-containing protein [Bacteroidales bacterium]|nr:DUF3244 domain-containing protein [Bacteroidales bacterium]
MRKFVTLLLIILFCAPILCAEEIKLNPKDPPKVGNGKELDRELINVPIASIENGVINIETELASWGVAVSVYDGDGVVVYSSVSNTESKEHSFAIGSLSTDDYIIEVQIGDDYYEGDFTIN